MSKIKYIAGAALTIALGLAINQNVSAVTEFDGSSVVPFTRKITGVYTNPGHQYQYSVTTTNSELSNLPTGISCTVDDDNIVNNVAESEGCELDLSDITISKPGKYVVTLKETGGGSAVYPSDNTDSYDIHIWYQNDLNADGTPKTSRKASIVYIKKNDVKDANVVFTREADLPATKLTVDNKIKGAFANANDSFDYTVTVDGRAKDNSNLWITNASTGAKLSECSYDSSTQKSTCIFSLKHGESVEIGVQNGASQVPQGVNYEVKQTIKNDYTLEIDGTSSTSGKTTKTVQADANNNVTHFINTSSISDVVDSKAFFSILPYIVLAIAATIAIYAVRKSKQNK